MIGPNICLMDLDGCLCDHDAALLRDLKKIASPEETMKYENLHSDDLPKWMKARVDMIRSAVGWWFKLKEFKLGWDVYNLAVEMGFEMHILTKGPKRIPNAWKEKVEWCQERLGCETHVNISADKGLVYGKVLVDDYPKYITSWLKRRPRGLVIMPCSKQNKDFVNANVIRYTGKNLSEVERALRAAYARRPGEPLSW